MNEKEATIAIDFPKNPIAILSAVEEADAPTLAVLFDKASGRSDQGDVWHWRTMTLLSMIDPLLRRMCKEFGHRFSRQSLDKLLNPTELLLLAFESKQAMPQLYDSLECKRLRAWFAIMPSIHDARDLDEIVSNHEKFLHPAHYIAMYAQAWLRKPTCAIPDVDTDLDHWLANAAR